MKEMFTNLKRFEVPRSMGGICPVDDPVAWIKDIVRQSIRLGLGRIDGVDLTYFLPESLLLPAMDAMNEFDEEERGCFKIGCAGCYREDVEVGGNFGAFTTFRPAASIKALGCDWVMIGHSEVRRDKLGSISHYCEAAGLTPDADAANLSVEKLLNAELLCALRQGMNALYCVGETSEQKGSDDPAVYEPRVREVLRRQLTEGFAGIDILREGQRLSIAYEPIWAIGPGKTPATGAYVDFVSRTIKELCREIYGRELPIVYGGGLKEENAEEIASVKTIDGGFVALTKFTPPIGFDVNSFKRIIQAYVK